MQKVDLHCHSIYSEHPSEWFLQRLGAKESYTDPFFIYDRCIEAGMSYVTITDHNKIDGALILQSKYPDNVFISVEATTYFPEDGCKIHILLFGITEEEFEHINILRENIYQLRDYIVKRDIAYSVAHASYSVNGKLTVDHLEKLILLFDVFEEVNGGRNEANNGGWTQILKQLTPSCLKDLERKHEITPLSSNPWVKGFTGGSDDHAGIFVGKSFTFAISSTKEEFLEEIKCRRSIGKGRHNNYHSLAFTVYKIAYDYTTQGRKANTNSFMSTFTDAIFQQRKQSWQDKVKLKTFKTISEKKGDRIKYLFGELVDSLQSNSEQDIDVKLNIVYDKVDEICDEYFRIFLRSLEADIADFNVVDLIRNLSSAIPGIFLMAPFFSSFLHMHKTLNLLSELKRRLLMQEDSKSKKVLWFSDTINDLNGVSMTIKRMGKEMVERGCNVKIFSSLQVDEMTNELPLNYVNLPSMYDFKLPFYECQKIKIPSLLKALKIIDNEQPDEIIISSPGPLGVIGLFAGKMMQIRTKAIYHTDFTAEASHIIGDENASRIINAYEQWFFNQADVISVPTHEYINILDGRGFQRSKMVIFKRGIEASVFYPLNDREAAYPLLKKSKAQFTIMFAGRVSKDKSLDILCNVMKELNKEELDIRLVIAGSGPYTEEMKQELKDIPNVLFTGVVQRNKLAGYYNAADFFVFPSITDTFGMVILESLACGCPAIVSNIGGPKEMIEEGINGFIVPDQMISSWVAAIKNAYQLFHNNNTKYKTMREAAVKSVEGNLNWEKVIGSLIG
ncbi:MAG: glycosyltransferase [Candidatus Cloacimonetes bacterium]|nr:glycosyltransferase [Candidatus Cloacimonadota bacterium]